jgi:hypothetical protein
MSERVADANRGIRTSSVDFNDPFLVTRSSTGAEVNVFLCLKLWDNSIDGLSVSCFPSVTRYTRTMV